MKAIVFETYVRKKSGLVMHFDILVPLGTADETVHEFGRQYLTSKGEEDQQLTAEACAFCYVEQASPEIEKEIKAKGYYIQELQGC